MGTKSIRHRLCIFAALGGALLASGCAALRPPKAAPRGLIMVSIDGLRPEFYLDSNYNAPTLFRLATEGARARAVAPIYPTVTYPNHTTLVTGVRSSKHGILSNHDFSEQDSELPSWYWEAKKIQVETLWDAVHKVGKKAALIGWPVTVGANAEWVIPEIFPKNGFAPDEIWSLTRQATIESLWKEAEQASAIQDFSTPFRRDQWMTDVAVDLIRKQEPDLVLLHLTAVDLAQHETGRNSPQTRLAIQKVDGLIRQLLESVNWARNDLLIVGDHGFRDVHSVLNLNALFMKKGWIERGNWKVLGRLSGAQMAIYSKKPELNGEILKLLEQNAKGHYRIISRAELDRWEAFPDALCAIEPLNGFGMGPGLKSPWVERLKQIHGEHGTLPDDPEMATGLIVYGKGIAAGAELGNLQITDVAPTAAKLLQIPLPSSMGTPIPLPGR